MIALNEELKKDSWPDLLIEEIPLMSEQFCT